MERSDDNVGPLAIALREHIKEFYQEQSGSTSYLMNKDQEINKYYAQEQTPYSDN